MIQQNVAIKKLSRPFQVNQLYKPASSCWNVGFSLMNSTFFFPIWTVTHYNLLPYLHFYLHCTHRNPRRRTEESPCFLFLSPFRTSPTPNGRTASLSWWISLITKMWVERGARAGDGRAKHSHPYFLPPPLFVFRSSMLVSGIGLARSGCDISVVWRGVFSVHIRRCAKPSPCFCACTLPGSPAAWHSPGLWATGSIPLFRLLHRKCLPV